MPPAGFDPDHPDYWQERILFALVFSGVFLAPWVLVPTLILISSHGHWLLFAVDLSAYFSGVAMLLFPSIPYMIRATWSSLILYSVGVAVIWSFGPYLGVKAWLFAFAVTAGVLLGRTGAFGALALNGLTFVVVGFMGRAGMWNVFPKVESPVDHWTVVTVNFMLLNVFTVVCISEIVRGLKVSQQRTRESARTLAQDRRELIASKRQLETEVEERKSAEQAARRNEQMYRDLLKAIPDAVVVYDAVGRATYVNDAFVRTYGWGLKDLLGRRIDFVPPEEAEKTARAWNRQTADGPAPLETRRLTKSGELLDVDVKGSNIMGPGGEFAGSIVVHRNVTARKRAERALKQNERRLQAILESNPDPVVVYDNQGCTTYLNPAFTLVFGWTMQDVGGKRLPFVPPGQEGLVQEKIEEMYRDGNPVSFETTRLTRQGREVEVFISAATIKDPDGTITGMVVTLTDISGIKRLEEQLRQSQKMEAIGTLAGGVAHDFNNLLQAISGYVQLLARRLDPDQTSRRYLDEIDRASERASELVRSLLTFGRKVEPSLSPVSLNSEVAQAVRILERTLPRMITIHTDLDSSLGLINGDSNQIEQVLLNLGANAGDAMAGGGRLTITTRNLDLGPDSTLDGNRPEAGRYVLLRVSDTGQGIDQADLDNIFDPFFTTKEIGKGTGLGLSTAYGIVQNHGGFIACQSRPGQGATFNIYFPRLSGASVPPPEPPSEPEEARGGRETILLVDDEQPILNMGREALAMMGYRILTAERGETALNIYRQRGDEIDLVILDLGMPGMGGARCLEELIRLDPAAKVLIASGYTAAHKVHQVQDYGAAGFIAKPYRLSQLLKTIRQTLD